MSVVQYELMDFCTMAVSITFILARPSPELHSDPRPRKLLSLLVLVPWVQYAILFAIEHGIAQDYVKHACRGHPEHYEVRSTAHIPLHVGQPGKAAHNNRNQPILVVTIAVTIATLIILINHSNNNSNHQRKLRMTATCLFEYSVHPEQTVPICLPACLCVLVSCIEAQ